SLLDGARRPPGGPRRHLLRAGPQHGALRPPPRAGGRAVDGACRDASERPGAPEGGHPAAPHQPQRAHLVQPSVAREAREAREQPGEAPTRMPAELHHLSGHIVILEHDEERLQGFVSALREAWGGDPDNVPWHTEDCSWGDVFDALERELEQLYPAADHWRFS